MGTGSEVVCKESLCHLRVSHVAGDKPVLFILFRWVLSHPVPSVPGIITYCAFYNLVYKVPLISGCVSTLGPSAFRAAKFVSTHLFIKFVGVITYLVNLLGLLHI